MVKNTEYMIPCLNCNNLFYNPPCRVKAGRRFCSLECSMEYRRKTNQKTCKGCGVAFYVSPDLQNQGKGIYCKRECYFKYMSKNRISKDRLKEIAKTYKQGATWTGTLKIHKCGDKTLQRAIDMHDISKRAKGETKTVIRRIKRNKVIAHIPGADRRKTRLPEGLEEKMIESYVGSNKSMAAVNKEFGRPRGTMESIREKNGIPVNKGVKKPPLSENAKRKISENHADVSGKNNPMYGKTPGHGRWTYVPHLGKKVRSTWEYEIALALLNLEIVHEFETNRIFSNKWSYMPDFYLPEWDMYIEVKGWLNERSKKKLRKLFRERPDISLLLISPSRYKRILEDNNFLLSLIIRKAYRRVLI